MTENLTSPLHNVHKDLEATFTTFGAWLMPLKYGKELEEHKAVRTTAGIFDLSHMGEIRITGPQAAEFLDYALISSISKTKIGQAKYTMIIREDGGIIDDLIVYHVGDNEFLAVPNAGNEPVVWSEFQERAAGFDVDLANETQSTALIAVQGPNAEAIILDQAASDDADTIKDLGYYRCTKLQIAGFDVLLARTGYTGEDGFEIYMDPSVAADMWTSLLDTGADHGAVPCGLAARDSLRLEAAMPLYGHELTVDITPVEAGMKPAFAKKEANFVGKDAVLERQPQVTIAGLVSDQKRAAREGAEIFIGEEKIGVVTSGQPSPTLGYPIALAHVDINNVVEGTGVEVEIRGKRYPFRIAPRPFYSREK